MMNPLLPVFVAGLVPLSLAPVYVGLMEGIAEFTASLLKLYSGRISDRLRRRKSLVVLGYGLSSVARPAVALAAAGWQVILLKFVDRTGKGLRTSPRDALIGDSVDPSARGLAFSFHRGMDHLGAVLGPLAAMALLLATLGQPGAAPEPRPSPSEMEVLRFIFAVALVPGLLATLALILCVREVAPVEAPSSDGRERPLDRGFYGFVTAASVFALGNSSDMFLMLWARTGFGFSLLQIAALWVALHLSKVIFSLPGGLLSDRVGRRPLILGGWMLYALVYLGLAVADRSWHLWVLLVIYGAYYGLAEGAEKALVTDLVPGSERGRAFGIYHAAVGLAALPASLLFGIFWAWLGAARAFGIGAVLAAVAMVLLWGTPLGSRAEA
ncbi:MAG: MFS transporter [Armatimonadetes bacterium]|nr:MFS transporter [Armatimonadota bacterium]